MNKYKIIDAHCHIYPDKIAEKASVSTGKFYDITMRYDGKVSTLAQVGKNGGIDHFIIQSVATKPEQVSSINRFISQAVKESGGTMTGLGTLHPESADKKGDVDELISLGLLGVKLHPDIQGFAINDPRCIELYELCEGKLPVLFHTGDKRYEFSNPAQLIPVLERFKNLTVIGAHFGGYSVVEEAKKRLPKYENLYVDCSSSFPFMTDEEIVDAIKAYGADRVLFGTDYPMWDASEEVERLLSLGLSDDDYEKIFHKNAEKLFGIKI